MSPIELRCDSRELEFLSPFHCLLQLRQAWGDSSVVLLESLSGPARDVRTSLIGFGPIFSISVTGTLIRLTGDAAVRKRVGERLLATEVIERDGDNYRLRAESDLWRALRATTGAFRSSAGGGTSFRCGLIGYLGYDVVRSIERLPYRIAARDDQPTLVLTLYRGILTFDLVARRTSLVLNHAPGFWEPVSFADTTRLLEHPASQASDGETVPEVPPPRSVRDSIRRTEYLQGVERALHYIRIGDIYQVQLGHELEVESSAQPFDVYRRLRVRNPSPYMYLMPFGDLTLIGASPESFLRIEAGQLSMRPIAGTARRGKTPEEDAELVRRLESDEKELAEHVMLVDLCRNDIGRVCEPGTLEANELLIVEQYSHVNHLVSNVTGKLRPEVDAFDAIAATFPAGTMTGAPKIRAMEIIEELETRRRGAYAGAVGLIDFSGFVNMALCIRSTVHRDGRYLLRASAGIVADSIPDSEWRETLHKMGATYWAVTGEELKDESLPD